MVGELQGKAEAAALWQGRAEALAHQLAEARETIRALQAPPPPKPAPDVFPSPIPPTPNAAPRFDRWQGRLAVAATVLLTLVIALVAAPAWVR